MRGPLIGGKDFQTSIGQGEQARGGVLEAYQGKGGVSCVLGKGKRRE